MIDTVNAKPWLCAMKEFLKGHRRESLESHGGLDLGR